MSFDAPPPAGGFGAAPGPGPVGPMGPSAFGPIGMPHALSSDRLAVIAVILGAMSLPGALFCMTGLPLGIAAVCVSAHAQKKIAMEPHLHHGPRMARAGLYCGIVGIVISLLYLGLTVVPFVVMGLIH